MKLLSLPQKKKVIYFGMELMVPFWTKYVATEDDGLVLAFKSKPVVLDETGKKFGLVIWNNPDADEMEEIATVDLEGMNWKETLVEV